MSPDVLIIGAGVNGLLSALTLAQAGLKVEVLDQQRVARESTWAGAGILSPLLPWNYGDEVNALSERGRALWPQLSQELLAKTGIDPEYWPCGMAVSGSFDLAAALSWCDGHAWPCTISDNDTNAPRLWLPTVAQARNPRLAKALAAACRTSGIHIHEHTAVRQIEVKDDKVVGLNTDSTRRTAGKYLVTAGAWSTQLLGADSANVHIGPVRGQLLLYQLPPGALSHVIYHSGKYIVPRRDGHILVGSTLEDVGFDKSTTDIAKHELQAFAHTALPALADVSPIGQWSGLRPGSPGNIPTIGRHPRIENLYINSGHFRYGVTMAPATAELILQLILDQPSTLPSDPYQWTT